MFGVIWSYSGPYLELFWSMFSQIRTEYGENPYLSMLSPNTGKYEAEKTPYLDTFHAVLTSSPPEILRKLVKL